MAQRTGAERFLAPPAKRASAGLCLALALAALLLCGCGGGSSDSGEAGTAAGQASGSASGGGSADSPGSPASAQSPEGSEGTSAAQAGEAPLPPGGGATGDGGAGKHGPHIAAPKGPREREPTAAEKAEATLADISLKSAAIPAGALPAQYTCDGEDSWPALQWSGVPDATKELILYAMSAQPLGGRLFFDWAVAGLDPASGGLEAGRLPKGAVVGTNSSGERGYSICPPPGSAETYIFALFALPRALDPQKGFDPRPLREEILELSRDVGLLTATYARQ